MPAILTSPPALEPVLLSEAKAHLKVDNTADDPLIVRLIISARQHIEKQIDQVLINQNWRIYFDNWPTDGELKLTVSPITDVIALRTISADDIANVVDPSHYYVDQLSTPQMVILRPSRSWIKLGRIANGIEVEVAAGYGATGDNVPAPLRQAMLMLIAFWYENRQPNCSGKPDVSLSSALQALLAPYIGVKL